MKTFYVLLAVLGICFPSFAMAQISLETLRTCLDIEDQTKERLDCYDEKISQARNKFPLQPKRCKIAAF